MSVNSRETPHGVNGIFSATPGRPRGSAFAAAPALTPHARRLLRAPAQDPHVSWHNGLYHYCESSAYGIFIRSAAHFLDLGQAESRRVWAPPAKGPASRHLWAPELHWIDGRCYIYFAADNGRNANHRMWVLAAKTENPTGSYELVGSLETGGWAIDGTILTDAFGNHIFVWSGWPGARNGQQNLYMARMKNPTTLTGPRVLLAQPHRNWECHGMPICEGPQILQRGGRTFIVYSASGSWTQDYCLGVLAHDGGDLMNPASWRNVGPSLQKNVHAWGAGHCCFVNSPDTVENWIIYHAKTSRRTGWDDREVRAQSFSWNAAGEPVIGAPLPVELAPLESRTPVVAEVPSLVAQSA